MPPFNPPGILRFERAAVTDAAALTDVQIRAFHAIHSHGSGQTRLAPEGYDSVSWQIEMTQRALYYKSLLDERIIGGFILFEHQDRHIEVRRVFVAPEVQNQGIGMRAFAFMELAFPEIVRWTLEVPDWDDRNQQRCLRLGYTRLGELSVVEGGVTLVHFEKRL